MIGKVLAAAMVMAMVQGARGQEAAMNAAAKETAGNPDFAVELLGQLDKESGAGNLFFSPYSITAALAMTAQGAAGQTRAQMDHVLHITGSAALGKQMAELQNMANGDGTHEEGTGGAGFRLAIANALWVDQTFPLKPAYVAAVKNDFHAEANAVDFVNGAEAARQKINNWVATQTNDKIKDLLPAGGVDKATVLVLTNAVYFKAAWRFTFSESATRAQAFHLGGGKDVNVPMMQGRSGTFLKYGETEDLQLVALPYQTGGAGGGTGVEMVLLVPKKVDGLAAVEKEMTAESVSKWMGAMESAPVQVLMPRFRMTTSLELADTLKAMGMTDAFTGAADFSGISAAADDRLRISAVVHKAYVDVNEQGTEAAAATGTVMAGSAMVASKTVIRADRPFMFLIREEKTGAVLFMGRVVDPGK